MSFQNLETIIVAKEGGDFYTLGEAISSITDNTAQKRYIINIKPGSYTESAITLKQYVNVLGSGIDNTILNFDVTKATIGAAAAAITSADDSLISNLTINNTVVLTVSNSDIAICTGDSVTFTALTGFTGHQWYDASGSITGATSSTYVTYASGSYYVIANDANGCPATSASTAITVDALPSPANLSSSNVGFNSVSLSWDAVVGISQYRLTYTDGVTSTSVTTTNTTVNITGLSDGTVYTWQIQSVCPLNNNIFSTAASASFTTSSCTAPSPPRGTPQTTSQASDV